MRNACQQQLPLISAAYSIRLLQIFGDSVLCQHLLEKSCAIIPLLLVFACFHDDHQTKKNNKKYSKLQNIILAGRFSNGLSRKPIVNSDCFHRRSTLSHLTPTCRAMSLMAAVVKVEHIMPTGRVASWQSFRDFSQKLLFFRKFKWYENKPTIWTMPQKKGTIQQNIVDG